MQSFLKHKDAKPLRDVLASNPNRFVPLLVSAGTAATVRPGSPSTATARLDLQFQAIKVCRIQCSLRWIHIHTVVILRDVLAVFDPKLYTA